MYLGLSVVSVLVSVWAVAAYAARPRAESTGSRDLERRDAQLRACPARVTQQDVERLLRSHPLSDPTIARVLGKAAERLISLSTLWSWADRFGADKLLLALDADVAARHLHRHLDAGTTPDWDAMSIFATLNNDTPPGLMPFDEILDLDAVPDLDSLQLDLSGWATPDAPAVVVPDVDLSQFDHLPPVFDPGLPVTRSVAPPINQSPRGDDGWPQVA
jgi:hypothetical protein